MRTRIISAFPGTGKTYYHNFYPKTTIDSDSSKFRWLYTHKYKERNPDFPNNYIQHIKENIGKYEFIFVSTHKEVREGLLDNCLFFYLIYPQREWKDKYIKRYKERNNDNEFIKLLEINWDIWLKELSFCEVGCKQVRMVFPSLEQEIRHFIASENGEKEYRK